MNKSPQNDEQASKALGQDPTVPTTPSITNIDDDTLKLWESMFGNATNAKAGNYTINYKEFCERVALLTANKIKEAELKGYQQGRLDENKAHAEAQLTNQHKGE